MRSRFDYGSVLYRSAAKSILARMDVIHAWALRVCLVAAPPHVCTSGGRSWNVVVVKIKATGSLML